MVLTQNTEEPDSDLDEEVEPILDAAQAEALQCIEKLTKYMVHYADTVCVAACRRLGVCASDIAKTAVGKQKQIEVFTAFNMK